MKTNSIQHPQRRIFVLDTNVLMHDPAAIFRFDEHDLYIPMAVLEELDNAKKGLSEVARNARQASRFLDELLAGADETAIEQGLIIAPEHRGEHAQGHKNIPSSEHPTGRLYFQTAADALTGHKPDNVIVTAAQQLRTHEPDAEIILVSKDINLRIKATILGIRAEDFLSDRPLDNVDMLYTGIAELPLDLAQATPAAHQEHHGYWVDPQPDNQHSHWVPNQCFHVNNDEHTQLILQDKSKDRWFMREATDHTQTHNAVWGMTARNPEQNLALNVLLDPNIDFVTLIGAAGSGKTLLALAAGLTQILDQKRYREILMTRVTVPIGEDIGFLPGTEEEKMTPWMGALMDNLEVLTDMSEAGDWQRAATNDLISNRIKVRSLNFMRGRTFQQRYLIIDEAQNLTPKQMKTLITRASNGTKLVCLGDISQIDTPYLTETTSGLTYAVDRFKDWPHSAHIKLQRGERSRLAAYASDHL